MDVGTGSGVLAIAAVLLGAGSVEGIDFDEDALHSARESVALNGLSGRCALLASGHPLADRLEPPTSCTANLTGALLVARGPQLVAVAAARRRARS